MEGTCWGAVIAKCSSVLRTFVDRRKTYIIGTDNNGLTERPAWVPIPDPLLPEKLEGMTKSEQKSNDGGGEEISSRILLVGRPDASLANNRVVTSKYTLLTFLPIVSVFFFLFVRLEARLGDRRSPPLAHGLAPRSAHEPTPNTR